MRFDPSQHRTRKVFELTVAALNSGDIATSKAGLSELSNRRDHLDSFASYGTYMRRLRCDADRFNFAAMLKALLDNANAQAELNRAVRDLKEEQEALMGALASYDSPLGWALVG